MNIREAFYIKLGAGGKWAADSLEHARMRFGWDAVPLALIHAGDWTAIRRVLGGEHTRKGTVSADTARLRDLVTSGPEDVWITFHDSHLYWGRLADSPVEEDAESKFRRLQGPWQCEDAKGRRLRANQIPGRIAQVAGFRGTVCRVAERDALARLLSGQATPQFEAISSAHSALASAVELAIRELHWKDFEILTDLVFRQAGWRRRTVLGKAMKYADIELEAPITREAFQVQIKSQADVSEFEEYVAQFDDTGFRRLYFVVHSPSAELAGASVPDNVDLVLPARLAELVVDLGLTDWLMEKVR